MSLNSGLIFKWLKSENTSSAESRAIAKKTRNALNLTARQYRKMLSYGRKKTKVLETIMSAGEWDRIDFSKIPSKAGFQYRNAFARHDIERMKSEKQVRTYEDFMKDEKTTVNAKDLYPYEVVEKAYNLTNSGAWWHGSKNIALDNTERLAVNKYWDNLKDYFNGCSLDALCMVDTSASMWGRPIHVAISLGLYAAERARGPFAGHYISFSRKPQLVATDGVDFVDKVERIYRTNICENTNIEAAFDMLLDTAIKNRCSQSDLPKSIVVISDMEFDYGVTTHCSNKETLMEGIRRKWERNGYEMPELVFWSVDSRQDNIPMKVEGGITMVSGFSPVTFEMLMKGKTGYDLMMDKLNEERYACIQ